MEAYARALSWAIPFFLFLIALEAVAARRMGVPVNRGADTISSLSSGITNVVKDVLGLSVAIISYAWLVRHLALITLEATWLVYLVAFVVKDFSGYWVHRLEHEVNVLWNRHIIHHSSEEFNLSCALRQSISSFLSFAAIFMIPAAILGVPAEVFAVVAPLHLFAQFWYHTRLIGRMGWLEHVFVTPSHHRVHHAINPEYLDRNYGQILILWDKWFGTFQPELPHVPPVYGVKRPVKTWNPIHINFQHLGLLIRDAWYTRSWRDRLRIWWMPTGWRPADVQQRFPVPAVDHPDHLVKYDSRPSRAMLIWSWGLLAFTLVLMLVLFDRIAQIPLVDLFLYGAFLMMSVYCLTSVLDRHPHARMYTILWAMAGGTLLLRSGGSWYGLGAAASLTVGAGLLAAVVSLLFVAIAPSGRISGAQPQSGG